MENTISPEENTIPPDKSKEFNMDLPITYVTSAQSIKNVPSRAYTLKSEIDRIKTKLAKYPPENRDEELSKISELDYVKNLRTKLKDSTVQSDINEIKKKLDYYPPENKDEELNNISEYKYVKELRSDLDKYTKIENDCKADNECKKIIPPSFFERWGFKPKGSGGKKSKKNKSKKSKKNKSKKSRKSKKRTSSK
jgi:hypothetical protein